MTLITTQRDRDRLKVIERPNRGPLTQQQAAVSLGRSELGIPGIPAPKFQTAGTFPWNSPAQPRYTLGVPHRCP
jgi:hypothetical protein